MDKTGLALTSRFTRGGLVSIGIGVLCSGIVHASAAENYNPPWAAQMAWANGNLFHTPFGATAYLEDGHSPWWQTQTAHPIKDYDASKLTTGGLRMDASLDAEVTAHRLLPGWVAQGSPSGINNVYTFTPGDPRQGKHTVRSGQNAFLDFGIHPIQNLSADIGAEFVGNYDQRYWFPVSDEHRMFKDDQHAKIVRGEIKYDNKTLMIRGFEGTANMSWIGQNDLFQLLPTQDDIENYRRLSGSLAPKGGELRYKSPFGTLNVLGGTEPRWGYGSGAYARYDAPPIRNLEQSIVYRNENIPFSKTDDGERRWALSYNASYPYSERMQWHAGVLYQPFRLNQTYADPSSTESNGLFSRKTTERKDAFGFTLRTEVHPSRILDHAGLGYTYLGVTAGNKQQIDVDATRTLWTDWTFSAAYIYRQPLKDPVPTRFEGTLANPGAFLSVPRGPDDPFLVQWDNRKAHLINATIVFDPTPGTPFFKFQPNLLDEWNLNPEEDAEWTGALQYRLAHYLSNTDRLYYWDEDRQVLFDPISYSNSGARGTEHPFSSATGMIRWRRDRWRVTADLSGGEALAGAGVAYTSATNFYKPSTVYMSGGLTVARDIWKAFVRYGRDVWGPLDYHTQLGWAYHHVYQAGASVQFLKDFEAGLRYVGTRMTNEFIGSDTGAFNEYRAYLTYHFTFEHNLGNKLAAIGRPLPQVLPEVALNLSDTKFTPDGSGPTRAIVISPRAYADAGILSWKIFIRNAQGEVVRQWDANGTPPVSVRWEGLLPDGKPLPVGSYRISLEVVDLYGNDATSPAQTVEIESIAAPVPVPETPVPSGKSYQVTTTAEGLRVTLSSLILFDVDKADLKSSAKEGLDQVVELLRAYPTNSLRISGHTDSSGSESYNQKLSERRAQAVGDFLNEAGGVSKSRIHVIGYGKRRPVASNDTEEGRQQNRRVEIDILK